MIIGIDHGYSAMKTKYCSFPSGVSAITLPDVNHAAGFERLATQILKR